jgi:hypothetical protein
LQAANKEPVLQADRRRLADDGTLSVGRITRVRSSLKDLTPAMTELPDKNMAADFSALWPHVVGPFDIIFKKKGPIDGALFLISF